MPQLIRCTARFAYQSGLPEDVSENVFHFYCDTAYSAGTRTTINTRLTAFYNSPVSPSTAYPAQYMSAIINRPNSLFRFAEISVATGEQIGTTVEQQWTLGTTASGASLPLEVALVTSFRGPSSGGSLPLSSRTGRIYLGPLTSSATAAAVDPAPTSLLTTALSESMKRLVQANDTTAALVVYSRRYAAVTGPTNGWTDNEWDTQRRRGNDATTRTAWIA